MTLLSEETYEQLHGPMPQPEPEPRPGHATHLTGPDRDGEYGYACTCTPDEPYADGYRTKADALADAEAHEKGLD